MNHFKEIDTPTELEALVAFFDLTAFVKFSKDFSPQEIFGILSEFYEFTGEIIESAGGDIIKFIGDAGLVIFPDHKVDEGVIALKKLKDEGDAWLAGRKIASKNIIKIHYGPVICGPLGTRTDKRFDIIGLTVNTAALLRSNGFAMSAQVFRKLSSETRERFKKHTPPITYIPVEESHRD